MSSDTQGTGLLGILTPCSVQVQSRLKRMASRPAWAGMSLAQVQAL